MVTEPSNAELIARWNEICQRGDEAEIAAFVAEVDALDAAREERLTAPGALQTAAVWYAANGIAVFRLQPRDKKPFPGSRGFKDATTDLAQVRAWWAQTPDANIGLPTGISFDVIDIDPPAGSLSLAELRAEGAIPEQIGRVYTARGGRHLYIHPTGDGNKAGILPGVDYRGVGGYVVAPPSIGANGVRYAWLEPINLTALVKAA